MLCSQCGKLMPLCIITGSLSDSFTYSSCASDSLLIRNSIFGSVEFRERQMKYDIWLWIESADENLLLSEIGSHILTKNKSLSEVIHSPRQSMQHCSVFFLFVISIWYVVYLKQSVTKDSQTVLSFWLLSVLTMPKSALKFK